ncbi:MAG: response regulator transcription factor [Gammaproteobacteria bacterium]|nr:response regulator transcription factor [Gammaproteobacteria bacterium]
MKKDNTADKPTVFVVDDDEPVRDSLRMLMRSVGLNAETFSGAAEFLAAYDPDHPGCLVLDIRMPGMSGMELQDKLNEIHAILPIIFITGHGDVPMAVKAIQYGAADFIQKPFRDQDLLDRINKAIEQDASNRAQLLETRDIEERLSNLTPREKEVLELIVDGRPNKVIAADLEVSQRTVEIHRARVMDKMRASSLAHLVRMVMRLRNPS